jgi:predicted RNase H-like HicB family nuclease
VNIARIVGMVYHQDMKWRVVLQQDSETGDWAGWVPELPGCTSAGTTQDEAMAGIREAIALYLQQDPIELDPGAIVREVAA